MSIHKKGTKWRVHWRAAGRQRTRTFDRKGDAITFEADLKRRRQLGPMLAAELDRETMALDEYVRGPWRAHAATLSVPTRAKYAWALEKHLVELVDEPLLALDVPRLAAHQQMLLEHKEAAPYGQHRARGHDQAQRHPASGYRARPHPRQPGARCARSPPTPPKRCGRWHPSSLSASSQASRAATAPSSCSPATSAFGR